MKPGSSGRLTGIVKNNLKFDLELPRGQNKTENMTAYKIANNEQLVWGFGINTIDLDFSSLLTCSKCDWRQLLLGLAFKAVYQLTPTSFLGLVCGRSLRSGHAEHEQWPPFGAAVTEAHRWQRKGTDQPWKASSATD